MPEDQTVDAEALLRVSRLINAAGDLESLIDRVLDELMAAFGYPYASLMLAEDRGERLVTLASRGYVAEGVGSEELLGEGLVGAAVKSGQVVRVGNLQRELRYAQATQRAAEEATTDRPAARIPLPRLSEAESLLVAPLTLRDLLVGALVIESGEPAAFNHSDEVAVELVAQHLAARVIELSLEDEEHDRAAASDADAAASGPLARFVFYAVDDSVFLDDEYLIRGVPGRILWRLLTEFAGTGRREFSNRELRMSPWIGLPALRDNLESRLILLRRRLDEKEAPVRLERTGRGRFALTLDGPIDLVERESP